MNKRLLRKLKYKDTIKILDYIMSGGGKGLTILQVCDIIAPKGVKILLLPIRKLLRKILYRRGEDELTNSRKLSNLLEFVKKSPDTIQAARAMIGLLSNKICTEIVLNLTNGREIENRDFILDLFMCPYESCHAFYYSLMRSFAGVSHSARIEHGTVVDLAINPVIAMVWNYDRLADAIGKYGTEKTEWRQNGNHAVFYVRPLNLTITYNGNHSICAGILNKTGKLDLSNKEWKHIEYDLSDLYNQIYFDGDYYRFLVDNENVEIDGSYFSWKKGEVAAKSVNFDFGCMFELGKLLTQLKKHE